MRVRVLVITVWSLLSSLLSGCSAESTYEIDCVHGRDCRGQKIAVIDNGGHDGFSVDCRSNEACKGSHWLIKNSKSTGKWDCQAHQRTCEDTDIVMRHSQIWESDAYLDCGDKHTHNYDSCRNMNLTLFDSSLRIECKSENNCGGIMISLWEGSILAIYGSKSAFDANSVIYVHDTSSVRWRDDLDSTDIRMVTDHPTYSPTPRPTPNPTRSPTANPTRSPTSFPSPDPTKSPSPNPSQFPSYFPSSNPTGFPSFSPSQFPTIHGETEHPTPSPIPNPTKFPSLPPTSHPSGNPTKSSNPTQSPSEITLNPTETPHIWTLMPSQLTKEPSLSPTSATVIVDDESDPSAKSNGNHNGGGLSKDTLTVVIAIIISLCVLLLGCLLMLWVFHMKVTKPIIEELKNSGVGREQLESEESKSEEGAMEDIDEIDVALAHDLEGVGSVTGASVVSVAAASSSSAEMTGDDSTEGVVATGVVSDSNHDINPGIAIESKKGAISRIKGRNKKKDQLGRYRAFQDAEDPI